MSAEIRPDTSRYAVVGTEMMGDEHIQNILAIDDTGLRVRLDELSELAGLEASGVGS